MRTFFILYCLVTFAACSLEDSEWFQEKNQAEESRSFASPYSEFKHCVIQATAVPIEMDLKEVPLPPMGTRQCFSSFSQAIDFATGGRVKLPKTATPEDVDEAELNNATAATTYVIAIEYEHAWWGGATLTYTSSVTCNGYYHYASSMPWGWNDVISSASAYSYCNHSYHYEHVNFGGAMVDCGTGCYYVGDAINDRPSSLFWTW